jgi:Tol biopolymer transport system component
VDAKREVLSALLIAASGAAPVASAAPTTERVSLTSQEAQVRPGSAVEAAISPSGRFVLFESASRVLASDDGAGMDLFVRDRRRGVTRTVTVRSHRPGPLEGSYAGSAPSISDDGRYVAFMSYSSNLVSGDTNGTYDVFVRDMRRGITTRLMTPDGREVDSSGAQGPTLSADGRYLAFTSDSPRWVGGDTNGKRDVFLHDRRTGATRLITKALDGGGADKDSFPATLAAGGRHVAFWSGATNLVRGDTNGRADMFVHDRVSGRTERVTVSSTGEQAELPRGIVPRFGSISANGRRVAFMSLATNLVPGDTNRRYDVFVRDLRRGETRRVSVTSAGVDVCRQPSALPRRQCGYAASISGDGRRVVFMSDAALVADDTNQAYDVFLHDIATRETTRVSIGTSGRQVCQPALDNPPCNNSPSISGDGRFVAFTSLGAHLVQGDTNHARDVFVRGPL